MEIAATDAAKTPAFVSRSKASLVVHEQSTVASVAVRGPATFAGVKVQRPLVISGEEKGKGLGHLPTKAGKGIKAKVGYGEGLHKRSLPGDKEERGEASGRGGDAAAHDARPTVYQGHRLAHVMKPSLIDAGEGSGSAGDDGGVGGAVAGAGLASALKAPKEGILPRCALCFILEGRKEGGEEESFREERRVFVCVCGGGAHVFSLRTQCKNVE